jgi:signal transduction histidine kinase
MTMHSEDHTQSNANARTETRIDADGSLDSSPMTILLVEDNEGDARLIEELLQMKGGLLARDAEVSRDFEIKHVERLTDALAVIEEGNVDIVLLDLMLPDSRGEETLDEILGQTTGLPIIVMTGLNDRNFGVEAVKRGAQDFLVKGEFDGELLVRTIKYAIERKKNERQLATRTEELEILTRILHHDIRNDMNIVRGRLQMGIEQVEDSEAFETALSNVEHAIEITETVEPLLESITGDGDLELEPISLGHVLGGEIRKLESSYPDVTVDQPDDLVGVEVRANHMLSSVFGNLFNNAVQHNDGDEPLVDIDVDVDRSDERVRVTVADDGPGIPDDRQDDLFDREKTGSQSSDTGLGLHLVDRLTDEYGGNVSVADSDHGGAAFVVELPLA